MSLAESKKAIGEVSKILSTRLTSNTSVSTVDVGSPESAAKTAGPKYNIFLYHVEVDKEMRNHSLDNGQPPPLWLVLHYLLTAFDSDKESDNIDAHELLGEGMLALQELNFIHPHPVNNIPLASNPEPLKVTFDSADSELLSKIMQGTDEKYRVSTAFQVRPVMIAPTVNPRYSLPVKTVGPPANEGVVVLPSLGPRLDSVEPQKFISGTELTIKGQDVNSSITKVIIGDEEFTISDVKEGEIKTTVPTSTALSAGNHPLYLVCELPGGLEIKSDCLVVQLLPEVTGATPGIPTGLTTTASGIRGDLTINGHLLGGEDDSIFVAFYKDGEVVLMLEAEGTLAQTSLVVSVSEDQAIPADNYFIIVRVNGAQATDAPAIIWSP